MAKVLCQFLGESESSKCGYCSGKNKGKKLNIGAFYHYMNCDTYEKILCRQWRRCGNYYYQPQNGRNMCCPQYTIRLDVSKFKLKNKSHKKVLRKVDVFLGKKEGKIPKKKQPKKVYQTFPEIDNIFMKIIENLMKINAIPVLKLKEITCKCFVNQRKKTKADLKLNVCFSICGKIKQKYKKIMLTPVKVSELIVQSYNSLSNKDNFIKEIGVSEKGEILIYLFNKLYKEDKKQPYKKTKKLKKDMMDTSPPEDDFNEIVLDLSPATFKKEEYEIYKQYQIKIHKDKPREITENSYTNFLIQTSLIPDKGPFKGVGTFHLQYRLKKSKKLIAVSVLDVLPGGLSSVYFFYDLNYSHLRLGVYSGLREIELIQKEMLKYPNFKYYYLGFYIHSCQKMRYKADFIPSELVCNETWTWVPVEKCKQKLDKKKYCKFADDNVSEEKKKFKCEDSLVLCNQNLMKKSILTALGVKFTKDCEKKMENFHNSVGEISETIAFYVRGKDIKSDQMKILGFK